MKRIFTTLFFAAVLVSCTTVNIDPNERNIQCDQFTSNHDNETSRIIKITTNEGEQLSIIAIGSARAPQSITFKYGKNCYIDVYRDVDQIVRINENQQKVTLRNGKVIKIGTFDIAKNDTLYYKSNHSYDLRWEVAFSPHLNLIGDASRIDKIDGKDKITLRNGEIVFISPSASENSRSIPAFWMYDSKNGVKGTPYTVSNLKALITNENGDVEYYSSRINPFTDYSHLSVLNDTGKEKHLISYKKLKDFEEQEYTAMKAFQANELRKTKLEQERKRIELDNARRQAQTARIEAEKNARNFAKWEISNPDNIGRKICKFGDLKYSWSNGHVVFGKLHYENAIEFGQIIAFLEEYSPDGYRIKFRVLGWANEGGALKYQPMQPPLLGEFSTLAGGIYWDDVKDWSLCL